jgi:hypothetical protein
MIKILILLSIFLTGCINQKLGSYIDIYKEFRGLDTIETVKSELDSTCFSPQKTSKDSLGMLMVHDGYKVNEVKVCE